MDFLLLDLIEMMASVMTWSAGYEVWIYLHMYTPNNTKYVII